MSMQSHGPVVIDTNVVSYINRKDSRAIYYEQRLVGCRMVVSFQTIEELWFGAINNGWGDRRKNELARAIEQYEIVWPDAGLINISARIRSEREKAGRQLKSADAWIAATALKLQCPLASHDRDFSGIPGLTLIRAPKP